MPGAASGEGGRGGRRAASQTLAVDSILLIHWGVLAPLSPLVSESGPTSCDEFQGDMGYLVLFLP